jgi:hypothetical protein
LIIVFVPSGFGFVPVLGTDRFKKMRNFLMKEFCTYTNHCPLRYEGFVKLMSAKFCGMIVAIVDKIKKSATSTPVYLKPVIKWVMKQLS